MRSTRLKKGWTAKHLSVVSGISTVEISQIENGRIIATDYERDRLMYYLKGW
ncbi:helix-turn-helix domain-containing protein [Limosilactobacillus reuteri]|uniref:helix-turn-helix domain-containing protein n=1 Tax=Limosilactobacillus reuteri TaxID=1598 RepID=UPI00399070CC